MSRQAPRLASRATQRDLWSLFELLKRLGIDGAEAAFLRCTRRRFGLTPGFRPSSGEIPRGPFLPTPSWRCGRGSREREREREVKLRQLLGAWRRPENGVSPRR